MEYRATEHINVKASLVVLVIDDFTGRVIADGSVQVSVEGAGKPIRKTDGHYVFINLKQDKVQLSVTGANYLPEKRYIDLCGIDRIAPVIKIRVKPGRSYPLQKSMAALSGKAEPFSEIRIICDNIQKYYRLLYDYDPEKNMTEISIFNPENADMDGKILLIRDKEEENGELVHIVDTKSREDSIYLLDKPLSNTYKKMGTRLLPIYTCKCDENGEYFITLYNTGIQELNCRCEMLGSRNIKHNITLECAKSGRLDFV